MNQPAIEHVVGESGRNYLSSLMNSSHSNTQPSAGTVPVSSVGAETILPSRAMELKSATGTYAMYLSFEERARLFAEIDYLLDPDAWVEEDAIPLSAPYVNFLKWLLEAKRLDWSSLGLDADGNLLCAYLGERGTVTAAFHAAPVVHWTSNVTTEDGVELSAGQSPLRAFVTTAAGLLEKV
ncbi:hypothetical protein [Rhizobium leguminosarum]|uniref:hypothetical protein n=1 Tax=Rhizobium leguminosarum TaxID=384 RepID=UPI00103B1CFA|nr:hypothetical protein [Rhizobium leguminosarum]TCA70481.1 hypothetical protein E0H69_25645 [Rhizobium leguminosarum bv. viciae]